MWRTWVGVVVLLGALGTLGVGAPAGAAAPGVDLRVDRGLVGFSEPLVLTATVPRPLAVRPTGTVTFVVDGTQVLGTVKLRQAAVPADTAVLRTRSLPPGDHTVEARYSGDRRHPASTSPPQDVRVRAARTTTTLRSATPVVASGKVARLVARVAPVAPALGVPTGTVTFKTATLLRTVPLVDGVAVWMPRLPDGLHRVRAVFTASPAWEESASAEVVQRGGPAPVERVDQQDVSSSGQTVMVAQSGPFPAVAQVVTAGVTGTLHAVSLEHACLGVGPGPIGSGDLRIEVRAMAGDSPTGAVLATRGADGPVDDALVLQRFGLSQPVAVTAGTRYAIVLAAPPAALGCVVGLAEGGQSLVQTGMGWAPGSTALRHRTWVTPAG